MTDRPSLFEERSHPNHWRNRASDLHASAGALWFAISNDDRMDIAGSLGFSHGFRLNIACTPVFHMLCGLSLEVGMKSVLASWGESVPADHNLNSLAGKIRLKLSAKEQTLLRYYAAVVVWAGRYPTPRDQTDLAIQNFYDIAGEALTDSVKTFKEFEGFELRQGNNAASWENFNLLWQRVIALRAVLAL